jgi:CelD/BcsL family acetyltransferase involved in cellulose biosynthesis
MEHIGLEAEPYIVTVREEQGQIIGLAPLCRLRYCDLGFRLKAVAWAGREVVSGDFLDVVAEPRARPEVLSQVFEFLWKARPQWSVLVLGELLLGGEAYNTAAILGRKYGLRIRSQEERLCPYIALPRTFDEYLSSLGSSTRYHIRRRMREFERRGAVVENFSNGGTIAEHLDILVRLHLSRWRKDNLPGTLGRPGFASFLRNVCANPPGGSKCRLYLLRHEDQPVAALLMFYFGRSALYYQAGWEPESPLAAQSPGVVLMAHSIRDAIEDGLSYYEFLRGDETYKMRWTRTFRKTSTLLLARGFMAGTYLRVADLKDVIKHRRTGLGSTDAPLTPPTKMQSQPDGIEPVDAAVPDTLAPRG